LSQGLGQSLLCTEPWPTARAFPFTFNQGSRLCTEPELVLYQARSCPSTFNQQARTWLGRSVEAALGRASPSLACFSLAPSLPPLLERPQSPLAQMGICVIWATHTLTCDDAKKILDDLTIRTVHGPAHRRRRDPAAALSGVLEQS